MGLHQLATGNESNAPLVERARQNETLHGRWLLLARCLGVVLTVFLLAYFIANLPVYFVQLQTVCVHALCPHWQLTPANARALQNAGLSVSLYAIFGLALGLFSALVWFAVAAFIAWRKSSDWMAGLSSLFLVTAGVLLFSGGTMPPLAYSSPVWSVPTLSVFLLFSILYYLVFSLFPNGRFVPSWMRWLVAAQIALGVIGLCLLTAFSTTGFVFAFTPLTIPIFLCAWTSIIGGQIYRYRRVSSPTERQQTKWVVLGLIVGPVVGMLFYFPPLVFLSLDGPGSLYFLLLTPVYTIASLFSPLCFGIALLRYRLWDVDVIINRTLVYGTLTFSIVALYALVVVGLGALLQSRGNLLVSLLATGLVAVLFQPLRERLQRAVNRLMYGERDEPYRVLARLGQRLEATLTPDAVLPTIVETVAQALKLPFAAITWTPRDAPGEGILLAAYGQADEQTSREPVPLMYQQEVVGEMVLSPRRRGESLTPGDQRFLRELAPQIGVAVHTIRLATYLKQLTVDLQRSREQLVTAREEERRRLRRDLHDGLGPQLSSQPLLMTSALLLLRQDPDEAEAILTSAITQSQEAISDIRRLVYALRPPALDDLGLIAAIGELFTQYRASGIAFSMTAPEPLSPLPAAVEVAIFRIVQEALTNVVRHAHAHSCLVRLVCREQVTMEIIDDGQGLPSTYHRGVGLASMRERAEELGGSWLIEPAPVGGTCVRAQIPYR
jgi:signal transduction histidine kinase